MLASDAGDPSPGPSWGSQSMPERLYVVDGYSNLFRAYHAVEYLSTSRGVPSHAVLILSTMLWKLIREDRQVSQPPPFAPQGSQTVVVPKSEVTIKEEKAQLAVVTAGVSIGDVVQALNALGVTPRDLIAILQAIRQAGALMAELEIM